MRPVGTCKIGRGPMDQGCDHLPDDRAGMFQIQLWLDGSMPAGTATGTDGTTRDFTGWVPVMSAVDALAGGRRRQAH
jgi:hypothetical protein